MPDGRKPTADYLKVEDGGTEPEPLDRDSYPPPDRLSERAAEYWNLWIDEAVRKGVVNQLDLPMFERMCRLAGATDRFYEAYQEADVAPPGQKSEKKKMPEWTMMQQALKSFRMYASEMGLTPTSRGKLETEDDDYDPMEEAFGDAG